ncbi:hypothetical protein B4N84_16425 [Flavobacterium sp. IR1]|nr:hypothetical protein B4N84_16425 [Flavobacterium sp. IR1]
MKLIKNILLLVVIQFSNAQNYNKIDLSTVSYTRNGLFSKNSVSITNIDNTKLLKGFYEMKIKNYPVQFYISKKGNVDGTFKEFFFDGSVASETILKEGKLKYIIDFDSVGDKVRSLQVKKMRIKQYNPKRRKWVSKRQLAYISKWFYKNGKIRRKSFGLSKEDVKVIWYYENGKMESKEMKFQLKKTYDTLGYLKNKIVYDWDKKEIIKSDYHKGKLESKKNISTQNKIWNLDGTITIDESKTPKKGFYLSDEI